MVQLGDCTRPPACAARRGEGARITSSPSGPSGGRAMSRRAWVLVAVLLVVGGVAIGAKAASDKRQEWARSGHANRQRARLQATVENRGETAAHCGRCHSEEGFLAWLPQLAKGNPGLITQPDGSPATIPYLASLGLTKFSVRPQTCNTFHNTNYSLL